MFKKQMMTLSEVADFLRVEPGTVYRWANSGEIPAFKVGNSWRFDSAAVEKWLMERSNVPQEPEPVASEPPATDSAPSGEQVELYQSDDPYHVKVSRTADYIKQQLTSPSERMRREWTYRDFQRKIKDADFQIIESAVDNLVAQRLCEKCTVVLNYEEHPGVKLKLNPKDKS